MHEHIYIWISWFISLDCQRYRKPFHPSKPPGPPHACQRTYIYMYIYTLRNHRTESHKHNVTQDRVCNERYEITWIWFYSAVGSSSTPAIQVSQQMFQRWLTYPYATMKNHHEPIWTQTQWLHMTTRGALVVDAAPGPRWNGGTNICSNTTLFMNSTQPIREGNP